MTTEISKFHKRTARRRRRATVGFILIVVLVVVGCRQDMQDQPKYQPLEPIEPLGSITDGRASRPLVEGTVARGQLREDVEFYTGKTAQASQSAGTAAAVQPVQQTTGALAPQQAPEASPGPAQAPAVTAAQGQASSGGANTSFQGFVTVFPMPITRELLDRGEERYNITCSVCHGRTGLGDGMVARRGFKRPPSLHDERLRNAPPGYFFDVITNGFGAMPDYASQITAQDRWAIVAFIRALQLSRQGSIADVPPAEREKLEKSRTAKPQEGSR
jgi:mono/diheme cytochrome c family protein